MRIIILAVCAFLSTGVVAATEDDHVRSWCEGEVEYVLPERTRVDCLTEVYAIEADWGYKWAEAVGQSLYYAARTGRKPGILLLVQPNDWRFVERLIMATDGLGIRLWLLPVQQ